MNSKKNIFMQCPLPMKDYPSILLAHGGGGKLMQNLITKVFMASFKNRYLDANHDGAVVELENARLAFTTDSHVVSPLFFPGGDIGSMAVYGTVNDLAMCGATPLYLSAGFIIEEGLDTQKLCQIVDSMSRAANQAGVEIVTGDTKVVDRGKGDGVFINTAGIGLVKPGTDISPKNVQPQDQIILSGDLGRHGIAIMARREGLSFETEIESDLAPLAGLVGKLLESGITVHCLRDLTRGGLSSALNEIAGYRNVKICIKENQIAVRDEVKGACEILGLDPLYVANEGRLIAFVPKNDSQKALDLFRSHPLGKDASIIGEVLDEGEALVTMKNIIGTHRIIDMLSGEQLPRIC